MSVKIDKNKPIPEKGRQGKYPWETLQVGDSFFVEVRQQAFGSLYYFNAKRKKLKQKQIRIETHKEGDGCRVWRIK